VKATKRTLIKTAAVFFSSLALSTVAAKEMIKVGTFVPAKSVGVSKVIKPWMDAVTKDVGSDVTLKGFWGGTLGKSPFKQFELTRNGVIDVSWVLPGYTAGQFPEMGIFELPFLFRTAEEASVVGWRLHQMGLLTGFDGVHVIGFFAAEPNALFMREKVANLGDLKNKKIRSAGGIHASWLTSLGAAPQTLSSGEMNEALNRGTIDGVIQGWTGMRTFKTMPLVNQAHAVPAGAIPFLLLMNQKKWDSLSPKVQAAIMKHGSMPMAKTGGAAYTALGEKIRADVRKEGRIEIVAPSAATMAQYAQAAQAVHRDWIKKTPNGQKVYDAAQKILGELR
jgi:TRAP-type C4-dicarboxylate transport system substrate-binding protein